MNYFLLVLVLSSPEYQGRKADEQAMWPLVVVPFIVAVVCLIVRETRKKKD
jgi:hypothetical protein